MDAFVVKVSFNTSWKSKAGMIENIESIVREYKEIRQLLVSIQNFQMSDSC